MKTQTAFSLIEVLVVLVIIVILASAALPNLRNFIIQNRMTTKTNELVKTINHARTESISHPNVVFSIVPLSGGWNEGWQFRRGIKTIKVFASKKNDRIIITSTTNQIDYTSRGRVRIPPDESVIQFEICSDEPKKYPDGRQVTIVPTGRVSSERIQCN